MQVHWSGTGTLVAIISEDSFYVLRFDREAYNAALASGVEIGDEGVEAAFEVVAEVSEGYVPASTHRDAPLISFLQCQDCQVGRRLLHLYKLCQSTQLPRRYANEYHYPFRYVSCTSFKYVSLP
jgi:Coatomer WD associated region